ncbi:MAG TPA: PAS domain-containing protein [Hyphomicrobiaceae bacterium]|nr:PAS domain-containing protein [Hyphomicrobiaceae bacterium]
MMRERTSRVLFAYWNEVRGERMAPRRFDIEPARISEVLSETFILEREEGTTRFRLAGTRIVEQLGHELRGIALEDLWADSDRRRLDTILASVVEQGGVGLVHFTAASPPEDGIEPRSAAFEMLLLPLVHTEGTVTRILGAISNSAPPHWLGAVPLPDRTIDSAMVIWPDGRPHSAIEAADRQAPFKPGYAAARIVRFDRRQFRVFDGGLDAGRSDRSEK